MKRKVQHLRNTYIIFSFSFQASSEPVPIHCYSLHFWQSSPLSSKIKRGNSYHRNKELWMKDTDKPNEQTETELIHFDILSQSEEHTVKMTSRDSFE